MPPDRTMRFRGVLPVVTIAEALVRARAYLRARGVAGASLDAEVLLAHCTGLDRAGLYREAGRELGRKEAGFFRELVRRRAAREPVAYLVGHREFMGLDFAVGPGVLIPRPETELLVEEALALLGKMRGAAGTSGGPGAPGPAGSGHGPPARAPGDPAAAGGRARFPGNRTLRLAEAGTGSGAVAVSLARHLPGAHIHATDISRQALETARQNALRHGVAERITFWAGDLLAPLLEQKISRLDLVAANLPYVPGDRLADLMPDVRLYEPLTALDGGPDGLALYRRLEPQARRLLAPGGYLLMEIDPSQVPLLAGFLDRREWEYYVRRDLAGRDRLVVARRKKGY